MPPISASTRCGALCMTYVLRGRVVRGETSLHAYNSLHVSTRPSLTTLGQTVRRLSIRFARRWPSLLEPEPSRARLSLSAAKPLRFEVCQNKYCRKKGSAKTLDLFHELAAGRDDVLVEAADMSHTEHGCFDECTMGPNVRVGGDGPKTDSLPFGAGRVVNGVKGEDAITELLNRA